MGLQSLKKSNRAEGRELMASTDITDKQHEGRGKRTFKTLASTETVLYPFSARDAGVRDGADNTLSRLRPLPCFPADNYTQLHHIGHGLWGIGGT